MTGDQAAAEVDEVSGAVQYCVGNLDAGLQKIWAAIECGRASRIWYVATVKIICMPIWWDVWMTSIQDPCLIFQFQAADLLNTN